MRLGDAIVVSPGGRESHQPERTIEAVEQSTKWYLIDAVAGARAQRHMRPDLESRRATFQSFSGTLSGLLYVEAIDREEQYLWAGKMLTALDFAVPERPSSKTTPTGTSMTMPLTYLGDGDPPEPPPVVHPKSHLLQSVPGPETDFPFHGSLFRVDLVEIYTSSVDVSWRLTGSPIVAEIFPKEMAELEVDLEGLDDWAADELRRKAESQLERWGLYKFTLSDDLGTVYEPYGPNRGNRFGVMEGHQAFKPTPPHTAWSLTLGWHDLQIEISLLDD
jgi:hypothetical protein